MKRLVTYGCSNTFGEGLPDKWDAINKVCIYNNEPSKYAWPQLLANNLKIECLNLAKEGTSNKFITNSILNTKFKKDDIVVIVWTYYSRSCFFQDDGTHRRIMIQDISNNRINRAEVKYNKIYYQRFYTDLNANIDNHMYFNLVKFYFDKNGIKNYHFTCNEVQFNVLNSRCLSLKPIPSWSTVSPVQINDCYVDTALDRLHPGVESHKRVAEKIKTYIQ